MTDTPPADAPAVPDVWQQIALAVVANPPPTAVTPEQLHAAVSLGLDGNIRLNWPQTPAEAAPGAAGEPEAAPGAAGAPEAAPGAAGAPEAAPGAAGAPAGTLQALMAAGLGAASPAADARPSPAEIRTMDTAAFEGFYTSLVGEGA